MCSFFGLGRKGPKGGCLEGEGGAGTRRRRVGGPGGRGARRVGARRLGGPTISRSFPSPATIFNLSSLSWGLLEWNCGHGSTPKFARCALGFSGVILCEPRRPQRTPGIVRPHSVNSWLSGVPTALLSCCAIVRATNLRTTSPTTIPTPLRGFLQSSCA